METTLSLAIQPIELTELFWKAKFSGKTYQHTKKALLDADLIRLEGGKLCTTEKGKKWLQVYKSLKKLGEAETHEC
jgi:predicted transcriptional regulator